MKKLIAILLGVAISLSTFVGCMGDTTVKDGSGNTVTDPSKIVEISVWNNGFGIAWLNALEKEFETRNPGTAVEIKAHPESDDFQNNIGLTTSSSTDLYFNYAPHYLNYKQYLEPLDDIIDKPAAEGETKTIAEKVGSIRMAALASDDGSGTNYVLSYSNGTGGIVYNSKLFAEYDLPVPNTTKELENLIMLIQEDTPYKGTGGSSDTAKYPLLHYPGYWQSAAVTWWLQYSGVEEFNKFFTFEGLSGATLSDDLKSVYQQEGMQVGLEALHRIVTIENATHPISNDTSKGRYAEKQLYFITRENALMYPCGSFLETEVLKNPDISASYFNNFSTMRMPVVSALANKLSKANAKDADLSNLIDYVDAVSVGDTSVAKPEWATNEDVELVTTARFATTGQYAANTICVPNYAEGKALAKKFIQFMFSDEGMKIFAEAQRCFLAADFDDVSVKNSIDTSAWSTYSKSTFELSKHDRTVPQNLNHPVRYKEGLREIFSVSPESVFTRSEQPLTVSAFLSSEWTKFKNDYAGKYSSYFNK